MSDKFLEESGARRPNHPCKLRRLGNTNSYIVMHCLHQLIEDEIFITQCCHCSYNKQGSLHNPFPNPGPHGDCHIKSTDEKPFKLPESNHLAHRHLVHEARSALRDVARDPNVTSSHTSTSLKELSDYIEFWQAELKEEKES